MELLAEAVGISKTFNTSPPLKPLDELGLEVPVGHVLAITGVSGQGKSTLLNILGGILRPDSGTVFFRGADIHSLSSRSLNAIHQKGIGFIFQTPCLFQALTVNENLLFSQKARNVPVNEEAVLKLIDEFGLTDHMNHLPFELSVGQKRRLAIARALLEEHLLILSDEPTNDLDAFWSKHVFTRLRDFAQAGSRSVVLVTHDTKYAHMADALYLLKDGKLVPQ